LFSSPLPRSWPAWFDLQDALGTVVPYLRLGGVLTSPFLPFGFPAQQFFLVFLSLFSGFEDGPLQVFRPFSSIFCSPDLSL